MEKICGIYKITNTLNGKVYIGQSIDIKKRWANHKKDAFWTKGVDYNYPLYRAIRKYGIDNFIFEVIEECAAPSLNEKEIYYIALYKSTDNNFGYNQNSGGQLNSHSLKLSEEDVSKIIHRLKTTMDNTKLIANDFGVGFTTIRGINVGDIYHRDNEKYPIRPKMSLLQKTDNGYELKTFCAQNKESEKKIRSSKTKTARLPKKKRLYSCPRCGAVVVTKNCLCVSCSRLLSRRTERPEPLELAKTIKEYGFTKTGKKFGVDANAIKQWCKSYSIPHLSPDLIAWYDNEMGITPEEKIQKKTKEEIVRPVKQIDKETGACLNIFPSQADALRSFGIINHNNHISQVCRGKRKSAYGYFWQYADEENT